MTKYKDKLSKAVYTLLKIQCDVVGVDIDTLDYDEVKTSKDPDDSPKKCFYELYSWTEDQEDEYKEKFIQHLQNNAKDRRELGCLKKTRSYIAKQLWPWWCLQFTFKYKKEETK